MGMRLARGLTSRIGRRAVILAAVLAVSGIGASVAYAVLPPVPTVPPGSVPIGVLAGNTSVNVLSVDAFTRAINQAHGTNAVLTRVHFTDGQSTGWHTHPGPNLVLVVSGQLTLTDQNCSVTTYGPGQGFATGLDVHLAVATGATDFYALYFLPANADVLRTNASAPSCAQ
jgi:quercetin dioxygenase-like cupin family protein